MDPEFDKKLQFLDPEIAEMNEPFSGFRNHRNGVISGSKMVDRSTEECSLQHIRPKTRHAFTRRISSRDKGDADISGRYIVLPNF